MVNVQAEWELDGEKHTAPAAQLLTDTRRETSPPETSWVFAGSYVDPDGTYAADMVGSLITSYHDYSTVIDVPRKWGRQDEFIYANTAILPPPGTDVRVRIKPVDSGKE
jgi:hypothetical protein